jgi:mono/diheme cytochrome c family protein
MSRSRTLGVVVAAGCIALVIAARTTPGRAPAPSESQGVVVPKLWDAKALEGWATPLAGLGVAPSFVSEEAYYAAPIDNLRTYPVYHPAHEPRGYRETLVREGPKPLIEPEELKTEADWIEAGRRVFEELDTAASRTDDPRVLAHFTSADAVDKYRDAYHDTMTAGGVLIDYRWVVDRDGKLKLSFSSCAGCHTRILPDGSLLPGAPSNFDLSDAPAVDIMFEKLALSPKLSKGESFYAEFGVPWSKDDVHARFKTMKDGEVKAFFAQETGEPPGTMFARFNGSPLFLTRMADLRGVRHRKYLDATATHLNRGPADIARYGILVEFADAAVFGPHHMLPEDASSVRVRPPDEAMYALGLYVYSLEPPASPYPFDDLAKRGQHVFEEEGCAKCHTPPDYTNNKLIAAPGFEPPVGDARSAGLDVSSRRVYTDPGLALQTRKGTGYYKVPSLRGVWYRGLYGHSGFVSSLEDWFDPKRQRSDYVPTGWRGPGVKTRAIVGHDFGLDLDAADKTALIAFLRTL